MRNVAGSVSATMDEDVLAGILKCLLIVFVIVLVAVVTISQVKEAERESVCIALGYKYYEPAYSSCVRGEAPVEMMKYELVLEGVHND